jgi:capsular polysaccharide transport system ATP-binding protein
MIELRDLCMSYYSDGYRQVIADNINAVFPKGKSVALLGRNGAGKSSLLKIIAGTMEPDSGEVLSDGTISWPVGFAGSFHPELTGAQNIRFIARVYGVDTEELVDFVDDFAELGPHYHMPVRSYSSGMRARLAFGMSMGIDFDTYLVDETMATGDAAFRAKSTRYFRDRLANRGAIVVSHGVKILMDICDAGAVLEGGKLWYYPSIRDAIAHHNRNMKNTVDIEDDT